MESSITSKMLLKYVINEFPKDIKDLPNEDYLKYQIQRLERLRLQYRGQSINKDTLPRHRARARDLEQSIAGMVAGIKFAISFQHFRGHDLMQMEGLEAVKPLKGMTSAPTTDEPAAHDAV